MLTRFIVVCLGLTSAGVVSANTIDPRYFVETGKTQSNRHRFESLIANDEFDANEEGDAVEENHYQIGNEWGKRPVDPTTLDQKSEAFRRAAQATARFGGATTFYLGKINGHHMMATNYHVLPKGERCGWNPVIFPLLGIVAKCEKFYGNWTGIDLALFSINVSDEQAQVLEKVGRNFEFNMPLYPGQELITIGFGFFNNPDRELMANEDSDCKVFSGKDDYRFIGDPDLINPADYITWSFANGCDVSHGDSGSAMVDRNTGAVVGIIWTAATNKGKNIQDSAFLDEVLKLQKEEVWTQLSYGVPAPRIREFLMDYLSQLRSDDSDLVETLSAVVAD